MVLGGADIYYTLYYIYLIFMFTEIDVCEF